jgi:hypothetical protein
VVDEHPVAVAAVYRVVDPSDAHISAALRHATASESTLTTLKTPPDGELRSPDIGSGSDPRPVELVGTPALDLLAQRLRVVGANNEQVIPRAQGVEAFEQDADVVTALELAKVQLAALRCAGRLIPR